MSDNKYPESLGLWKATEKDGTEKRDKNGKMYYSGKVEDKQYANLFIVVSDNPKSPDLRLVLPDGYKIVKVGEGQQPTKEVPADVNSFNDSDIPF